MTTSVEKKVNGRAEKRRAIARADTAPRADVLVTLAVIAAVASVVLTGAAFWLSYEHLHDVAAGHGLAHSAVRAWAWPATVDLFIVIGEVLILRASLRRSVDPWAIGLTITGSGGSIALNVAGVGANAEPMNYVVAAVPPIAALLAFGALMRQLHGALAARLEAAPSGAVDEAPERDPFRELAEVQVARKYGIEALPEGSPLRESVAPQSAPADALPPAPKAPPADASGSPEASVESAPEDAPRAPAEAPRTVDTKRPESASTSRRKAPRKAPRKRSEKATRADAKAAIEALYDTKKRRPREGEMTAVLKALPGYPHDSRQHANTLRKEIERERPDLAALGSDNVLALTGS